MSLPICKADKAAHLHLLSPQPDTRLHYTARPRV